MSFRFVSFVAACALAGAGSIGSARADAPSAESPSVPLISQGDLIARLEAKDPRVVVLDVRTPAEFAAGHVPGARNVSHDELATRLAELESARDQDVVLYCRSGRRSALAGEVLRKAGFTKLLHLDGDFLAWQAAQRPVETSAAPAAR